MSTFTRLQKRLSRLGIESHFNNDIYTFNKENTTAQVLLPNPLPLEEKAVEQLLNFASVKIPNSLGKVCTARATPDFHPGTIAPVGSIVATTQNFIIPAAIGTDINCGMRLFTTGLSYEQVCKQKSSIIEQLKRVLLQDERDVPVTPRSFQALFDQDISAWLSELPQQGLWNSVNYERLWEELDKISGNHLIVADSKYAPEAFFEKRDIIRPASLGTVGSGNHFVELQIVDEIFDRHLAYQMGLKKDAIVIMIHTGSRDVGFYIGKRWQDKAKELWPVNEKYPTSGLFGLSDDNAQNYLQAMGVAARYAWINRIVITELIRKELIAIFRHDNSQLIVDISHNIILSEHGMNIHRKGATPANQDEVVLIPGSMGDYSYVAVGKGNPDWLWSCSHGAGRAERRQSMRSKKVVSDKVDLPWQCISLKEERLREEAPAAYKPITPVINSQQNAGLIQTVAKLKPWITFKA
ncbi:RtcB family protein [Gilliamella sp. Pra-s65]|uniref:RtcB family protein n=1 Tax=unclassified Gilliamella TaxID=2685620 RepID=UPI001365B0EC|nr:MULTISPECIES: RtcB family protein [unclassified Gilliamella]MWN90167.1 RtcB family protein [Gilliamella sp. Pra-s65]MWP73150.1 RtcB family protein [Gilliamella sp. Pra-s52]